MLHCSQAVYVLFSNREINIYFCKVSGQGNFSGQSEHNHFSHLVAFAHHEGFFVCMFGGFVGFVCVLCFSMAFCLVFGFCFVFVHKPENPNTIEINT